MKDHGLILVTGATGYVGGQLIPRLLEDGYQVRVFVRDPGKLNDLAWSSAVQVSIGDVLQPHSLGPAVSGVDAAYYLIHNMTAGADFDQLDVAAAQNFGQAARAGGVKRLIYLGGLGNQNAALSEHLQSRQETGRVLRRSGICLTEFRTAIIVGSGSMSFEMIRYLTERVPIMVCPRWIRTKVQPIAIDDVISYMVASLREPRSENQIIEIGGADVLTYGDLMQGYARMRGLRRRLLHVPVLTPRLSSYWVHWVTPVAAAYARPLIEGLRSEVVVTDTKAREFFPEIVPLSYDNAVAKTLSQLDPEYYTGTGASTQNNLQTTVSRKSQRGMIVEVRQKDVRNRPETVYRTLTELGGSSGWPCDLAWRLRAAIDRAIGGIGMRRGRPTADSVKVGDIIDFLRVVKAEPFRTIRLKAEMKLPGDAWLQFDIRPVNDNLTRLTQTVLFAPKGLVGLIYWYMLYPVHRLIFNRMINELAMRAEDA